MSILEFEIVELHNYPQHIEVNAIWSYAQWGCLEKDSKFEDYLKGVKESAQTDKLPKCWMAVHNETPIGMVTLKQTEHPDRLDLSPWLGGLYVHPNFRSNNIGIALCKTIEKEAKDSFGFKTCYLQTPIPEYYEKIGWSRIGHVRSMFGNENEILMQKTL